MELEQLHSRIHEVWQAHDQLVSITGADDGVTGLDLDSRLQALEHDMQQVHVKTEELDRHINKMLTKMIEFANQGGAAVTFISYIVQYFPLIFYQKKENLCTYAGKHCGSCCTTLAQYST